VLCRRGLVVELAEGACVGRVADRLLHLCRERRHSGQVLGEQVVRW
jgi:hypothetical protein